MTTDPSPVPSSPKPPKAPRRAAFGSHATSTAPVAAPPPADETPAGRPAGTTQPAPAPQAPLPPPPAAAPGGPGAEPVSGGQLAELLTGDGDTGGAEEVLRRLLAGAPIDPMLDLVPLSVRVPRHYKQAMKNMILAGSPPTQQMVIEALTEYINARSPGLLAASMPRRG